MQGNSTNLFGDSVDPTHRFCPKCKSHKPVSEFRTGRHGARGRFGVRRWRSCIECLRRDMRDYFKTAKGQYATKKRTCKKYGITPEDYDRMATEQGGACSICGETDLSIDPRTGRNYELAIDHCHATGKVRSLLCPKCNNGLGCFRDRPELLQAAISYLKKHQVQNDETRHD